LVESRKRLVKKVCQITFKRLTIAIKTKKKRRECVIGLNEFEALTGFSEIQAY
jgi:hypothetical protein